MYVDIHTHTYIQLNAHIYMYISLRVLFYVAPENYELVFSDNACRSFFANLSAHIINCSGAYCNSVSHILRH